MKQNKFDRAMDYIDQHIKEKAAKIRGGIAEFIGIPSSLFAGLFKMLTNEDLSCYIRGRKLYFVGIDLIEKPHLRTIDIAVEYGYADDTVLAHTMKSCYGYKPIDVRSGKERVPNDRYYLADILGDKPSSQVHHIIYAFEHDDGLTSANIKYWTDLYEAGKEYDFDLETCIKIADLAEDLCVPVFELMHSCFMTYVDVHSDPDYASPETETMIRCDIESTEELAAICKYYDCMHYDLDELMVTSYRENKATKKE